MNPLRFVFSLSIIQFMLVSAAPAYASDQPNIMVILADDMGYGDWTLGGSEQVKTPNLAELAMEGISFTRAYVASSVCSPSRAGLVTGRDPRRFGYQANLNNAASSYPARAELQGLPNAEHTFADQLKPAGYATGLFGKWHLGSGPNFHPNKRGFDHFAGMLSGNHNYFPNSRNSRLELNGQRLTNFNGEYLTDWFTDQAIDWIGGRQKDEAPWFAFMSYNAPHTPMQAKPEHLKLYEHIPDKRRRAYAAMMHSLDENIGRLRTFLKETKSLENTIIVFFSDNGGATNNGSWNGNLSGAKGCLKEGGIRVPMIISWPEKLRGGIENNNLVSSLDLVPTFVAAAKTELLPLGKIDKHQDKKNRKRLVENYGNYDGMNLLPHLVENKPFPDRRLFFRLQGQAAIMQGNYKLIRLSHRSAQMFDVHNDPSEQEDLILTMPEKANQLFSDLGTWESRLTTAPLWSSSPYWDGDSSKIYDNFAARNEESQR